MQLDKLIEENPRDKKLYLEKAMVHINLGDREGALNDMNDLLRIDSTWMEAYHGRGVLLFGKRDYIAAINDFSRAIQLDSNLQKSYHMRSMAFGVVRNYESAIDDLDYIIKRLSPKAMQYIDRGNYYVKLGKYESAVSDFRRVISLSTDRGDSVRYGSMLVELLYVLKKYEEAMEYLPLSGGRDTMRNFLYYYRRGVIHYGMKLYQAAMNDFLQSVRIDSEFSYSFYYLTALSAFMNEKENSLRFFAQATSKGFFDFDLVENNDLINKSSCKRELREMLAKYKKEDKFSEVREILTRIIKRDRMRDDEAKFVSDRIDQIALEPTKQGEYRKLLQLIDENVIRGSD